MHSCKKCGKGFRDRYNLDKHMSRLRPCSVDQIPQFLHSDCVNIPNVTLDIPNSTLDIPNSTLDIPNSTLDIPNSTLDIPNSTLEGEPIMCEYCLHTFCNTGNKNKHMFSCKFKEDPVRLLEMELDIIPELPESRTECRFCNVVFSRTDVLQKHITKCKERESYKKSLLKEKERGKVVITNNTNCNNTTINNTINNNNNNLILNFGETKDTTSPSDIIQILRDVQKDYLPGQIYLMTGETIVRYDKLLSQIPENKNFKIPNEKSFYAEIKTPTGWEKMEMYNGLSKCVKNRASQLLTRKDEINAFNEKVFKNKINNQIFDETKNFASDGLKHNIPGETRRLRKGLKINKIDF
jgi:hypothetical protein